MADYWAKLYIEILDDPKMATLPDRLWRRIVELFLVAKRLNKNGHLPETRQIAWMLRMTADDLDMDMAQIAQTGIVIKEVDGWFIPKFEKRQGPSTSTERVHAFRKRQQKQQYYADETKTKRNVTQSTEAESETESELIHIPQTAKEAQANPLIKQFIEICKMIPGQRDYKRVMDSIELLQHKWNGELIEKAKPYWLEWKAREYNETNPGWLDWAINERIPKRRKADNLEDREGWTRA